MGITEHDSLPVHVLPGIVHRTVAGREQGLTSMEVWHQIMAPGAETPLHRHACEEVVFVLSGRGRLMLDGEISDFHSHSTLVVPPDAVHQITNTGSEPLVLLAALGTAPVRVRDAAGAPLPIPWHAPD